MISRAFRFRLYPDAEQEETLGQWVGAVRFVYNLCLEQRRDFWRPYLRATGSRFNFASQGREVTTLRQQVDWIAAVPTTCLTQALRDLDRAFANFFAGRARFPGPRLRGRNDGMRLQAKEVRVRRINRRWAALRLPNLGWVKFRQTRELCGRNLSVTVSRVAGVWHAAFACEVEHEAPANGNPAVGIDRGIAVSLALSSGEVHHLPGAIRQLDRRKRAAQRILARRKRGSRRRLKQLRRVASLSARIARVRADWQHRISRSIADRFGLVAMEDLKVRSMTASGAGKRGLNRSILDQGWAALASKLRYKLEERGGALVLVDPAYSSQTCAECGVVDAHSRKNQAAFECTSCGHADNADRNAARIILRRSTPELPVEGRGCAPCEAGTMLEAA